MARELNPADVQDGQRTVDERSRIPMSAPKQLLDVPEIPGYVLYWFADRPGRIARAVSAGYEFVKASEVGVAMTGFANDLLKDGNTDLGSNVSLVGGAGQDGAGERLYLMKIKKEWWEKDQAELGKRNESIAAAIRGGSVDGGRDETAEDRGKRYGGQQQPARSKYPDFFTPKRR